MVKNPPKLTKISTNHGKNGVMKPIFNDLDALYNRTFHTFRRKFSDDMGLAYDRPSSDPLYFAQLKQDFYLAFPFAKGIKLNLDSNKSIYKDRQLHISTYSGISSPFEAILHELGHCLYFVDMKKLDRVRYDEFGFSSKPKMIPPSLRLNKFKNELMAGAYQMKMMIMAGMSVNTITEWLAEFCNSFNARSEFCVDKLMDDYPIETFKNDVIKTCDNITEDHVKKTFKVLSKCFVSDKLTLTGE